MSFQPHNEKELLRQMAAGDELAFNHLYQYYQPKVFAYAYHHTKLKETAEEVVQHIFTKLWEKRMVLEADNNVEGYIIRMAKNHLLNLMRDNARDKTRRDRVYEHIQMMKVLQPDQLLSKELTLIYHKAIEQLPPQKKIIYRMRQEQGLKNEEIARQLQLSVQTVKKHMTEAVRLLKKYFSHHYPLLSVLVYTLYEADIYCHL